MTRSSLPPAYFEVDLPRRLWGHTLPTDRSIVRPLDRMTLRQPASTSSYRDLSSRERPRALATEARIAVVLLTSSTWSNPRRRYTCCGRPVRSLNALSLS